MKLIVLISGQVRPVQKVTLNNDLNVSRYLVAAESYEHKVLVE